MKKRFLIFPALILCTLILSVTAFADSIGGGTVTASSLNLREQANVSSNILDTIPNGAFVIVESKENGWYRVAYNGSEGYVSASYVNYADNLIGNYGAEASIKGTFVRLRSGPSTDYAQVLTFAEGAKVNITGVSGNWLKVRTVVSGTEGYVRSDFVSYLSDSAQVSGDGPYYTVLSNDTSKTVGEKITETAMQYLGCPYVWGGMSPSGFDCSGFVGYVMSLNGYSVERVAHNIYTSSGSYVWSKDDLLPGDILCFGSSSSYINHVGIYLGNGQFIHSGSSSTGVIITELNSGYYQYRFQAGKRVW